MLKIGIKILTMALALCGANAYAATSIRVIGNVADSARISRIVQNRIVLNEPDKYLKVIAQVERIGENEELTLQLLSKNIYLLETAKITVKRNTEDVISINRNIAIIDRRLLLGCPDTTVDFVMATPVDEIGSAVAGVQNACATAISQGYNCKVLLGDQATVSAYKRYLSCSRLKGLGNIGHGNTSAISLADGSLSNTWFDAISDTYLNGKVLYFNSCQVHNPVLEPAVMSAGTRTFAGGNINLLIGPSEEVFKCFWQKVLVQHVAMGTALTSCESEKYPTAGAHGISGFTGLFRIPIIIRTPIPFPPPRPPIPPLP